MPAASSTASATGIRFGIYGQTASAPQTLDTGQTAALGAVGTPTLDVDALAFGTAALAGVRGAHQIPLGSSMGSVHGAVEVQPRPSGTDPAYWRGTTIRLGGSLTLSPGESQLTTEVEVSKSFADSLGGRNLFPGGGTVSVTVIGTGPIREESDTYWQVFGFYFRPFSSAFPDQPNRLLPVGDFMGVDASLAFPVGALLVWPTVDVMREASHTTTESGGVTTLTEGQGWTVNLGATSAVPLRDGVDITPGAGYVFGAVAATSTTSAVRPPITISDAFRDRIRGWWTSLELSFRF